MKSLLAGIRVLLVLSLFAIAAPVTAQETGERGDEKKKTPAAKSERGGDLVDTHGLEIPKPDGWVARKPGKGAVAVFSAAGDEKSQIEFRVADEMNRAKAQRYFNTFHTNLKSSGLSRIGETEKVTYGENEGTQTEYEMNSSNGKFRLIVWQAHQGEAAWLVVGFFRAEKRERYARDLQQLIAELKFD